MNAAGKARAAPRQESHMTNTLWLLLPTVLGLSVPGISQAQLEGEVLVELEEVIVSANRREENLQEVAISVAAFTGKFFKNSGTTSLKQLDQYKLLTTHHGVAAYQRAILALNPSNQAW